MNTAAESDAKTDADFILSRGMRFRNDSTILRGRLPNALRKELHERKECEAVLKMVTDGDRILELGGGIGYVSTLLATKRAISQVTVYEANPALADYIAQVHRDNGVGTATVHNALLSAAPGDPLPFYIRPNILASSMEKDVEGTTIERVAMITRHVLPDVLAQLRPDVLVCDIEGAEADLLPHGDWNCLRAAIIELHPQWIAQRGVQAVFDCMHRAGLTYYPKASDGKVVAFRRGW